MRAARLIACVVALIVVAAPLAAGHASAGASADSCPARDAGAAAGHPPVSARPGAKLELVPPGAVSVLLCHYTGLTEPAPLSIPAPEFTLWAHRLITAPATAAALASALDAIRPTSPGVAISCPADFLQYVVAYFGYAHGPQDPVTIGVHGCDTVTNGLIHRLGLSGSGVSRVIALVPAPPPALVRFELQLCGGPAPGRCWVGSFSVNNEPIDRVAILSAGGRTVAAMTLHHGRSAAVGLIPGRFVFKLLGADGSRPVSVREGKLQAGRLTQIRFVVPVP